MADMHRPGRIGRHVFDIDRAALPDGAAPIVRAGFEDRAQRADPGRRLERQVDEARARHLDLRHQVVGAQLFGDRLGQLARLLAGVLGQHHGGIGRHVAVGGLARRLDHDAGLVDPGRQDARGGQFAIGRADAFEDHGKDVLGRQIDIATGRPPAGA